MERVGDMLIPSMPLLLHIGAGAQGWKELCAKAEHVVLVEPDPVAAVQAETWLEAHGGGETVQAAVAARTGWARLNCTRHAPLSSTRAPTGALELFPGLSTLRTLSVRALTPRRLVRDHMSRPEQRGCGLVIEAPSEVLLVLSDLHEADLLGAFELIVVKIARAPLHEGGAGLAEVQAWLDEHAFKVNWRAGSPDPEIMEGVIAPDWERRAKEFETDVSDLRAQHSGLADTLEAERQSHSDLRAQYSGLADTLEAERQSQQRLNAEIEKLRAQHSGLADTLEAERQSQQRLNAEIEKLREDNRLSLRLQRLAQADVSDLQAQHADLLKEKTELERVLEVFAARLRAEIATVATDQSERAKTTALATDSSGRTSADG